MKICFKTMEFLYSRKKLLKIKICLRFKNLFKYSKNYKKDDLFSLRLEKCKKIYEFESFL